MLKWTWLSWMAVGLALVATTAALPPPERSYKILMLLPTSSISHRNVFMPLATALTERGHKVCRTYEEVDKLCDSFLITFGYLCYY